MPNWCEGSLRIRGKKDDIKNFLKNELICTDYNETRLEPEIEEDKYGDLVIRHPTRDCFYINNTYRNFIFSNQVEACFNDEEDEDEIINIDCFNSAWALRSDGWADHATKYNLDFRMFGYEQGMQFSQIMTVLKDGTVKEETQHYNDWYWDCPFPNMGG